MKVEHQSLPINCINPRSGLLGHPLGSKTANFGTRSSQSILLSIVCFLATCRLVTSPREKCKSKSQADCSCLFLRHHLERTHTGRKAHRQASRARSPITTVLYVSAEPRRNSPDALGCVISPSDSINAKLGASILHRAPDVEDRRETLPGPSLQENARAWLSDDARLMIISTPEDHIRPNHSYLTLFPVRALDLMVHCIRGSGATGRAYRRCMAWEPLAWSTDLPLSFWKCAMIFW